MNKVKFLLVLAFLVVMAAGAVVGMAVDRRLRVQTPIADPLHHRESPFARLKLTSEQQQKILPLWAEVDKLRRSRFEDHRRLNQKREQEIQALLTPEQRTSYDAIQKEFRSEADAIEKKLDEATRNAEEQTRAALTPEQQKIYAELRSRFGPSGARRGGFPRGGRPRATSGPTSRPASITVQ